jgi:transposase
MEIDIQTITEKIERISNEDASCQRLRQIPGFGPLSLHRHRDCDRQRSCLPSRTRLRGLGWRRSKGGKQKLFGISKRGNVYLRRMLIHVVVVVTVTTCTYPSDDRHCSLSQE